jgi:hypothetical protein
VLTLRNQGGNSCGLASFSEKTSLYSLNTIGSVPADGGHLPGWSLRRTRAADRCAPILDELEVGLTALARSGGRTASSRTGMSSEGKAETAEPIRATGGPLSSYSPPAESVAGLSPVGWRGRAATIAGAGRLWAIENPHGKQNGPRTEIARAVRWTALD